MNAPAVAAETRHSSSTAPAVGTRVAVQPVILAGGSGTRLWPMSRERFPKQLIGLLGEHSLLQSTALRLDGLAADHPLNDDVLIVCGEDHRFTTAEQLRLTGKSASIMLEPIGRDTAPALTLAAFRLVAGGNDAVMTVMPADHAVADLPRFHAAVAAGVHCAMQGKIATMGIVPKHAETGFGYIRVGAPLGDAATGKLDVRRLDRFVEKPHLELAQQYVASGEYWWNSGIFIVRASVWLKAIRELEPAIYAACEQAVAQGKDPAQTTVSEFAEGKPVTIGADDDAQEILRTMSQHKVRRLPVIDGHRLIGIVAVADVARALPDRPVGDLIDALSE